MAEFRWFLSGLAGHSLGTSHRVDAKAASNFTTKVCFLRQKFGLQGVAMFEFSLDKCHDWVIPKGRFSFDGNHYPPSSAGLGQG